MPQYTQDVTVTLLPGSGLIGDNFVVNAHCQNCRGWKGGKIDMSSTKQPMLYALGPESDDLASDSLIATIQQHDYNGLFSLNIPAATGAGGVPVISGGDGSFNDGDYYDQDPASIGRRVHATFMLGAFIIGFPLGYILLRAFERVTLHALIQTLSAIAVLLGMGSGVGLSIKQQISPHLTHPHQLLGLLITLLVLITWVLGFLGHRLYRRKSPQTTNNPPGLPTPSARPLPTKIHRILSPLTVLLGLANAGYGFHFAGSTSGLLGFIVIATLMILFVVTVTLVLRRRKNRRDVYGSAAARNFREGHGEQQQGRPEYHRNQYGVSQEYTGNNNASTGAGGAYGYYGSRGGPQESGITGEGEAGVPLQTYASPSSPERRP